ncbi:hypothetical protein MCETE4_01918 [Acidimicrobiia bacterium]
MSNKRRVRQHRDTRAGVRPGSPFAPDDDVIERIDGASARFVARGYQPRSGSTEPLPLSNNQFLGAVVSSDLFWDTVDFYKSLLDPNSGCGRPRKHSVIGMVLAEYAGWTYKSVRAAFREFDDPDQWENLRRAAIKSHPTNKQRRLPEFPPSRAAYLNFRKKYVESNDVIEQIRQVQREFALRVARHIGLFDIFKGSFSHPAKENVVYGDATFIQAMFNELTPANHIDYETGEIIIRRRDPDAVAWHQDGGTNGRAWVSVSARTQFTNERVILDLQPKPVRKTSDATVFTNMVSELVPRLPAIQATSYDMAFTARHADTILSLGVIPLTKIAHIQGGITASRHLGPQPFDFPDGTKDFIPVDAIGGAPFIYVTFEGEHIPIQLEMRKLDREPNRRSGYRIYGRWRIPDRPEVPKRLRGAIGRIRHNSTDDEIAVSRRRTRALRPIAPGTDQFHRLFGLREDSESMHNHLKSHLVNRRARTVGLQRQQLNMHAYQGMTAIKALIAHSIRTGASLDEFFGNWRPPDKT